MKGLILDRDMNLPPIVSLLLSPFKITIGIDAAGNEKALAFLSESVRSYLETSRNAPPLDEEQRVFMTRKREQLRNLLKANDPGYPFMVRTFGEELTRRIFDTIF